MLIPAAIVLLAAAVPDTTHYRLHVEVTSALNVPGTDPSEQRAVARGVVRVVAPRSTPGAVRVHVDTASLELHGFAFTNGSNVSGARTTVLEADIGAGGRQVSSFRGAGEDRPATVLQEILSFLLATTPRPGSVDTVAVAATNESWGFTRVITWDSGTIGHFTATTGGSAPERDGSGTESGTIALTAERSVRVDVTRRLQLPSEHGVITVDQQIMATAEPLIGP